jgi:tetratricopeptide (TPR) repeat protein
MLKAKCLIGLTEYSEGEKIIESLLLQTNTNSIKHKLLLELATVEFNLNRYDKAILLCNNIIEDKSTELDERGQSYEMLGLISAHKNNDLKNALNYFNKASSFYERGKLNFQLAQNFMNIGIVYSIQGNHTKANSYWDKSLQINRSIGNIEQEAKLLMNYGIYYYEILDLEKSTESYEKALSIFISLDSKKDYGFLLFNLSEIYLLTCEYQKALGYLNSAINTFKLLNNMTEELEAVFMSGKLNFILGDFENLNLLIKKFEICSEGNGLNEKQKNYYQLLTILKRYNEISEHSLSTSLNYLRQYFFKEKNVYDYMFCTILLIKNLIKNNLLNHAFDILNSDELVNICNENSIFEAERNYMIGEVVNKDFSLDTKSQIDYFNIAYDKISNTYITELTWKVLFSLSEAYNKRGNLKKTQEYGKYALYLINFIAENIKDFRLRNIYLEEDERKKAIEKLNSFEIELDK